jgi:hypothetical protein
MKIERTNKEILIKIPNNVNIDDIQNVINIICYKELTSDINVNQEQIDDLASEIDNNWWKHNKDRLLK